MSVVQRGPDIIIAINESLSGAIDLGDLFLVGLKMPAAWTAADLTFQGGQSLQDTFVDIYDKTGAEATVAVDVDRIVALNPMDFAAFRFIKVRSGPSSGAVAQTAARTIKPLVRGLF